MADNHRQPVRTTDFRTSGAPPMETPPELLRKLRREREQAEREPDEQPERR
ncbi:hypothetical protein ACFWY9_25420 [Amycolatopsis sp. NPDC059027]|uniref:hypothetical protein n=1 Tax=unclassified Amycolatopsis TaxID=2618356 RepID=UPI00366DFC18